MGWCSRPTYEGLEVSICSEGVVGFFVRDEATMEAIRNDDPRILEALKLMVEQIDEYSTAQWARDLAWGMAFKRFPRYPDEDWERNARQELNGLLNSRYATPRQKERAQEILGELDEWVRKGRKKEAKRKPRPGFIYLLCGAGYYKIGLSKNVDKRITKIAPKMPFEVELVHTIETDDMEKAERFLHEKFADKRTKGEWFELDEADMAWIRAWDGKGYKRKKQSIPPTDEMQSQRVEP